MISFVISLDHTGHRVCVGKPQHQHNICHRYTKLCWSI